MVSAVCGRGWKVALLSVFTLTSGAISQSHSPQGLSLPSNRGTVSVLELRVPDKARSELGDALARLRKEDSAGALKHVNRALAIAPNFPAARSLRGYLELESNQLDEAEVDLDAAISADPKFAPAYLHLGVVQNRQMRFDDALVNLRHDAAIEPNSWECHYEMAKAWLGKHEYEQALNEVNRSVSLGSEKIGPAIHFIRADALYGLKNFELAYTEVHAFLLAQPSGRLADVARELERKIRGRLPAELANK